MQAPPDDDDDDVNGSTGGGVSQDVLLRTPMQGQSPDMSLLSIRGILRSLLAENVVVFCESTNPTALLSQLGKDSSLDDSILWAGIAVVASEIGRTLNAGSFNETIAFEPALLSRSYALFNEFHRLVPNKELVLRRTRRDEPVKAKAAVEELIISAYAAHCSFGPQIHAFWMAPVDDEDVRTLPTDDFMVGEADYVKVYVNYITEKWVSDLHEPLEAKQFDPVSFANAFCGLLRQSIQHGFWQTDSKPGNMLYRYTSNRTLALCWTDFDSRACFVFPALVNDAIQACSVLVHAASFMGYVSCVLGHDVFLHYQPVLKEALIREFHVDTVTSTDMCTWLDQFNSGNDSDSANLRDAKQKISKALLHQMRHYITDYNSNVVRGGRCILTANVRRPTFQQMLDFALLEAGKQDIESWAQVNRPVYESLKRARDEW